MVIVAAPKWRALADKIAAQITEGQYAPGEELPHIRALVAAGEGSGATVHRAYQTLAAEGYVTSSRGHGTVVRDRRRIRVPLSRYGAVLAPGGTMGPWESATAAQGLSGGMKVLPPERLKAPADIAAALSISTGDPVVRRDRQATIGADVVQIQSAWYPLDVATAAGLDGPGKIVGGILGAMVGAGLQPTEADERVTAWVPTPAEVAALSIGATVPVLLVERVTRDQTGRPIEVVRITGAADRLELIYDRLPLTP
ncbi:GntR family transcriptional regulator [Streptomyces sp. NBC_00378]|uniref:GntR family transcriptional regulator n=1 Tax=Streptomyces sp. NBC_00378 TaxID=2975732 RepID=UPI00225A758F|nr:GntR family transcriptional regulator [Streptomyces sp. NBC_00378]MCX5115508.1 GntR family transcriptional regulator [Streptomyces sp. NBC_00378]MCX5115518.1 GntR family transcriptional regulator [Streptomyces sp. NBC_00378]